MRLRHQKGFTLIELMVTVVVAVVLAALAVPSFRDLIEKSRLRGATDDIVNLLNTSRASAVKLGLDVNASVKIASSTSWCAGAVSATDPESATSTIGKAASSITVCDCTSATACTISGIANSSGTSAGQTAIVSSDSYSGVQLASANNANALLYSAGGVVFNSKFGALDLSSLANLSELTLTSKSGRFQTQITMAGLGQAYVCTPSSSGFVSGYPSC